VSSAVETQGARLGTQGPFALDLRALAAFRIGLAVLLVTDLIDRWTDFAAHYAADGVMPRSEYADTIDDWHLSLHMHIGDVGAQLLLAAGILLAVLLAAGWRTRLVTLLSWLLLCSLHSRNYMVLQSGDTALRLGLFWGLFLPLGARWSVDAWRRSKPPAARWILTAATVALIVQFAIIYVVAIASKLNQPLWWRDGLGVHYSLYVDQFTTETGVWLRGQVGLVRALDYGTLAIELLAPLLILCPWRTGWTRLAGAALAVPMHLGMMITMEIGLFSWIMLVWWLAMLPAGFWDRVDKRLPTLRASRQKVDRGDPLLIGTRPQEKAAIGILAIYCVWWLAANNPAFAMPRLVQGPVRLLRLEQRWDMFSNPPRTGGWYVVPARLADGRQVDLLTGEAIDWDRPALPSATIGGSRWIKYMNGLERARRQQAWYLDWQCRRWNDAHPESAAARRVELIKMEQKTVAPGKKRPAPTRVLLSMRECR
jgi:hypothetical protein